jgi:hypothetical protein
MNEYFYKFTSPTIKLTTSVYRKLCYPTDNSLAAEPYDCEAMPIYSVVDLMRNKSTTEIDGHHLTVEGVYYSVVKIGLK